MDGCVCVNIIGYLLVITGVVVSLEGLQIRSIKSVLFNKQHNIQVSL